MHHVRERDDYRGDANHTQGGYLIFVFCYIKDFKIKVVIIFSYLFIALLGRFRLGQFGLDPIVVVWLGIVVSRHMQHQIV